MLQDGAPLLGAVGAAILRSRKGETAFEEPLKNRPGKSGATKHLDASVSGDAADRRTIMLKQEQAAARFSVK